MCITRKLMAVNPRLKGMRAGVFAMLVGLLMFSTVHAEMLTLDRALQIATEQSSDIVFARNNLEKRRENLNAQNASLKSQISFDMTPFYLSKDKVYDEFSNTWYTSEARGSSASLRIGQRIRWTDANLTLTNNLGWTKNETSRELPGVGTLNEESTTYDNRLMLTLSQPLFTYNRTQQTLEELELSLRQAELSYASNLLTLEKNVASAFFGVFRAKKRLEISEEDYQNKQESYNIIKNKVDAGISAQEELLQAEINYAQSRADLQDREVAYENSIDEFKILLGMSLTEEIDVDANVTESVVQVDLNKAVESGLKYSMELLQADISIKYAENSLIRTGAQDEFSASVDVSYGLTGTDEEFEDIYRAPLKSQGLSVQLSIPIWDWGKKKSLMRAGEIAIEDEIRSKKDAGDRVVLNVRKAYRALQNQVNQIEIAEKNVENARLTYEINLERYKNGDISSKDIGEYQNQLSNQQLGYVTALINYRLALLDLKIASLWDFENDRPVLDID